MVMEQHSPNSSMGKAVASPEESGWTSYFEDFSNTREPSSCSSLGGSSLLSDAASCAARKFSHHNLSCSSVGASPNLPTKLTFKKTRTKQISEDDPLEDTASSPVNSPKVGELHPTEMISRKTDDRLDGSTSDANHVVTSSTSMGKGFTAADHYSESEINDKLEMNLKGKRTECRELKKRGLCLVPLSMLVNYLG